MPSPRGDLHELTPYAHAVNAAALAPHPGLGRILRMGSNENPLGPSPRALLAMQEAAQQAHRYPQPDNARIIQAIARHWDIPEDTIVTGNGGDECIDLLLRALASPNGANGLPDAVLAPRPCFDVYRTQALVCGLRFLQTPLKPDFSLPLEQLARAAHDLRRHGKGRAAVVFVTSPDNPSGLITPREDLLALARELPADCFLLLDEAYVDFCDAPDDLTCLPEVPRLPNLGVLRTFSKAYGLAGARLGFMALPQRLAEAVRRVQIPFSVNSFAQAACLAAMEDREHYARSLCLARQGREQLDKGLRALGCEVPPSQANFLMFRPPCAGEELFASLLRQGILVRNLAPNGLPGWLRVTVGLEEECQALLEAVAAHLSSG